MSDGNQQDDSMRFDVIIVGAGPAGLATAIRLRQDARADGRELSVCVVDKAGEPGGHTLSGAVMDPRGLDVLLPDWREESGLTATPAREDHFWLLSARRRLRLPVPPQMCNRGHFVVSLGEVVVWLAARAEALGVEIFCGFAAQELLIENGRVCGVRTGDMGRRRDGQPGPQFEPGLALYGGVTVLAEGARGSLSEELKRRFDLCRASQPQTYGLGIKEVWEIPEENCVPGRIIHTVGWPLDSHTYGGSFVYHMQGGRVALGFVVGLDYWHPGLSPYQEFQRFKHHPEIAAILSGGRRISYGARTLNEGGFQALPKLSAPGALLVGCAAGFLDVPRIKGIHMAIASGIAAADAISEGARRGDTGGDTVRTSYEDQLRAGWVGKALHRSRNIRPGFRFGLWLGMANAALETWLWRGRAPWTLTHGHDRTSLLPVGAVPEKVYPKPDGRLSFDRLTNLAYAGANHEEDQPCHLRLCDPALPIARDLPRYGVPERLYCPAGVYEVVEEAEGPVFRINAANCVHCKACDIKNPDNNIRWTPPQGGEGPRYNGM